MPNRRQKSCHYITTGFYIWEQTKNVKCRLLLAGRHLDDNSIGAPPVAYWLCVRHYCHYCQLKKTFFQRPVICLRIYGRRYVFAIFSPVNLYILAHRVTKKK